MMTTLSQIGGMIRYEALMQFRRRTLILIAAFFTVGMIVLNSTLLRSSLGVVIDVNIDGEQVTTITRSPSGELVSETTTIPAGVNFPRWLVDVDVEMVSNTYALLMGFIPGLIVLTMACLAMLTEIIPLDYRFKVDELLQAAPLSKAAYLAGKVLSVWLGLTLGLSFGAVLIVASAWVQFGAVDLWLTARFWVLVILPIAFVASGIAVLIGGLAKTRRAALFIGIAPLPVIVTYGIFLLVRAVMANLIFMSPNAPAYDSYAAASAGLISSYGETVLTFIAVLVAVWIALWGVFRVRAA